MSPQERVAQLESLLERILRNATASRSVARASAPVSPAPVLAPPAGKSNPFAQPKPVSQPFAAPESVPATEPKPFSQPLTAQAPIEVEPVTIPPEPVTIPPEPVTVPPEAAPAVFEPPVPATPPPAWAPEPPSAVQSRPGTVPPEELSEDDLLDVTTVPPAQAEEPPPELTVSVDSEAERADEQAPASSRRSKVAETLDEALASAAELEQEEEREVPVKTPPPESGPQEAAPPLPGGLEAPGVPDVRELEADLLGPPSMGPTAEQLGETIELDAPVGPELEIDVIASGGPADQPERPPEELEISLPRAPMPSGTYDVPVTSPPLEVDVEVTGGSPDGSLSPLDMPEDDLVATVPAAQAAPEDATPERTARAAHGATDVARVVLAPSSPPRNFVELLDISLGL